MNGNLLILWLIDHLNIELNNLLGRIVLQDSFTYRNKKVFDWNLLTEIRVIEMIVIVTKVSNY